MSQEIKDNSENMSELTFEAALIRIEEIVDKMESSDLNLQESLAMFQEGVELIKGCHSKLDHAEAKIQLLITGEQGLELKEVQFEEDGLGL